MSFFRTDERTKSFLEQCAVVVQYKSRIDYSHLRDNWQADNSGRPKSQQRIQEAVESYALQMMEGSQAPAVVVTERGNTYDVLDGCQRLMAAREFCDATQFAAYIVTCDEYTADKIRICANTRINGAAQVDPNFTLAKLVDMCLVHGNESVTEIAKLIGRSKKDVQAEYSRQILDRKLAIAAEKIGRTIATPSKGILVALDEALDDSDWELAPKQIVEFVDTLARCKMKNGESIPYIKEFGNIKRTGGKKRATQLNTRLRHFRQEASIAARLAGKRKHSEKENVARQIKSLLTSTKSLKKSKCHFEREDRDLVSMMDEQMSEIARYLRESCTVELRRDLDPFV